MRITLTLSSEDSYDEVRQALLELTRLRTTISVHMVAAVDGAPRILGLRELITAHLDQRRSVLGPNSDDRIRAELDQLASQFSSPRRTTIEA
jgi:DNA gyrase subunit A